jgi:hypothetical protein
MKEYQVRDTLVHGGSPVIVPYGTYVGVVAAPVWTATTVTVQQTNTPADDDSWATIGTFTENGIVSLHGGLSVRLVRTAGAQVVALSISKSGSNPR